MQLFLCWSQHQPDKPTSRLSIQAHPNLLQKCCTREPSGFSSIFSDQLVLWKFLHLILQNHFCGLHFSVLADFCLSCFFSLHAVPFFAYPLHHAFSVTAALLYYSLALVGTLPLCSTESLFAILEVSFSQLQPAASQNLRHFAYF